ncbi:MAG: MotA/TolQ/ExbB proton channel family protein [Spirochaetales bacterium]|nr:MotA/TolQ/ExbB proton channel family protein [Spirochaetales bacterium]
MVDLFIKGGLLMWPLAVLSVVALAVILEREFFYLRNRISDSALNELKEDVVKGSVEKAALLTGSSERLLFRFLSSVFANRLKAPDVAEKEISLEGNKILFSASRFIHILELIGSVSPMIGLSGTVVGMVKAFQQIGIDSGSQIDPSLLADGIWVAMITTVAGLFVAIPCLIFAHINNSRIKKLAFTMKIYGEEINTILRAEE